MYVECTNRIDRKLTAVKLGTELKIASLEAEPPQPGVLGVGGAGVAGDVVEAGLRHHRVVEGEVLQLVQVPGYQVTEAENERFDLFTLLVVECYVQYTVGRSVIPKVSKI